ncbi:MAG: hypothetical protein A2W72_22625 [Burkholderiales bacterium RIFCSPLOWO2_12_67_14]|nr:MAG: hypothetical protein A3I64_09975 [Burkholderiales bacterium RIFCSPLOWO2_02_FULL_67_64]OGB43674.1 MAG: hypothetical protein A3E51_12595 [Burkholderiales bacterium RIFCSPHIGHO2_12_FULL_67_38]OGB44439.1 MAG: hypothetical protein A2W72_22625 [Burkholderiales bacterium RIFCSPLOWO2_12_67_14]OGC01321.1 MAG: hypothetical protein A3G82_15730 [Burkholderiales bacterium RIFCSPLOWO2_12_FULL_67_210]
MVLHRWVGLVMAGFLLVAGLTGALLAWYEELEAWVSPQLVLAAPPSAGAQPLDPLHLRERVQALHPQALVAFAPLAVEPGHALVLRLFTLPDPATGTAPELPNDQVFVNPYTGEVLGQRKWGDISQGLKNLMPFLYRLHFELALGVVGSYAFGIVALLWTLDCFVGAYLTFPARTRKAPRPAKAGARPWLARWWPSWKLRWRAGGHKLNFDLHRAGGLWVWAMLFVLAWSSVAFNLRAEVYDPVMRSLFAHQPDDDAIVPPLPTPRLTPAIDWHEARHIGRLLMAEQAQAKGFTVLQETALVHDPRSGIYRYQVKSSRDIRAEGGSTRLVFEADTGAFKALWLPSGAASGDTLGMWLTSLHMGLVGGIVGGWPMKLFVCAMGLVVAMLSVTGVVIWLRKRGARHRAGVKKWAIRRPAGDGGTVEPLPIVVDNGYHSPPARH